MEILRIVLKQVRVYKITSVSYRKYALQTLEKKKNCITYIYNIFSLGTIR